MEPSEAATPGDRLRVFVDADVLFAGAASGSEHPASLVVLRLAEIPLIEAIASTQVLVEAERNLAAKLPVAVPAFHTLAQRCLRIVPDPPAEAVMRHAGAADADDLPLLVAALRERCPFLVTINVRHHQAGVPGVRVVRPGELVGRVREWLAFLDAYTRGG